MSETNERTPGRKPTIGLVVNNIEHSSKHGAGLNVWLGAMKVAKERGVNLLCFRVDFMSKEAPRDTAKILYELVDSQNVDGLIFFLHWDEEKFKQYCSRFSSSLPIVNIRRQFDGCLTISQDDYQGMKAAMTHLIEDHGHRRIAYIRGTETVVPAQNRYRGYVDALDEYNIPFNADLVSSWSDVNQKEMGNERLRELLDERNLRPGIDFDAIAVTNDRRAHGVMEALAERNIRIPYDVAVISFDNLSASEFTIPPLTTMANPHIKMGQQGAELLCSILENGDEVPDVMLTPPMFILRQSCGCLPVQAAVGVSKVSQIELKKPFTTQRDDVLAAMVQSAMGDDLVVAEVESVLDAFVFEVTNESSGKFLESLDEALRPIMINNSDVFIWHNVILAMRTHLRPYLKGEQGLLAEDILQQASVLIGKVAYLAQKKHMLQRNDSAALLQRVRNELATQFEVDQLMDKLAANLPKLGIPSAILSLYEDPEAPGENARLILSFSDIGRDYQNEGEIYPSRQLLPNNLIMRDRQSNYVIESLHYGDKPFGFIVFEVGPLDGNIYAALGREISNTLQGSLLVEQVKHRAKQMQASVEVTEAISKVLDPNELIQQVVDLIRERFDLYYVGLFVVIEGALLDPSPKKYALLQAGTGDAGRKMVAKGHKLEVGDSSLVGQCVATGEPSVVLDVEKESAHLFNLLLPETRSELALPLISRGETIGALGLQSVRKSAFDREDIAIFQTMASQLAGAIENARLFNQAEEAMDKLQSELKAQVRGGWNRYIDKRK